MSDVEVRTISVDDLRMLDNGGQPRIDGRAIVYDALSEDLGGFREKFAPGAVRLDADLLALFDHQTSMVLGRTSAGTLEVTSGAEGVDMSAYPPDTSWARDLRVSMERGDIKQMSFRFRALKDNIKWDPALGTAIRTVLDAEVSELSVVSMPAYTQTSSSVRSRIDEVRSLAGAPPAPEPRAIAFSDTLADGDADRAASFSRLYQLEGALESTIYDCLDNGIDNAADLIAAAADEFSASVKDWSADHIAKFGHWWPETSEDREALREAASDTERTIAAEDIEETAGAVVDSSEDEGGAPSLKQPEMFVSGVGFVQTKEQ